MLIETIIPPGTIEKIIKSIITKYFKLRDIDPTESPPLIAHSYERVMLGKEYVRSIKNIWRSYSAIIQRISKKAREFLINIIDTKNYPFSELHNTNALELGKILENSYRAMNPF